MSFTFPDEHDQITGWWPLPPPPRYSQGPPLRREGRSQGRNMGAWPWLEGDAGGRQARREADGEEGQKGQVTQAMQSSEPLAPWESHTQSPSSDSS